MITYNEKFIEIQAILASSNVNTRDCAKINDLIIELSKENQELKQKYENAVADYETTMVERNELKKQLEETDRKLFLAKNELDMRQKSIDNKLNQQKEFIKYLEDESKEIYRDGGLRQNIYKEILQKYKSIIGGKDE